MGRKVVDKGETVSAEVQRLLSSTRARAERIRMVEEGEGWKSVNNLLKDWLLHDEDKTIAIRLAAEYGNAQLKLDSSSPSDVVLDVNILIDSSTLHCAAKAGCHAIVKLLLECCQVKRPDRFQEFLSRLDDNAWTALHYACQRGHRETVKLLLQGNPVNLPSTEIRSPGFTTPLHLSIQPYGCEAQMLSREENIRRAELVQLILDSSLGSEMLNSKDAQGNTALHLAVETINVETVELLLQQSRLLVAECNGEGKTPLHIAWLNAHSKHTKNLPSVKIIRQYLARSQDVQHSLEEIEAERARHYHAANAILVGGALIVSITFQGILSGVRIPPLEDFESTEWPISRSYYELVVKMFRGSNNMSFYFAVFTMLSAITQMNSRDRSIYHDQEMKRLRRGRMFGSLYFTISTIYAVMAFVTGGLACVPVSENMEEYILLERFLSTAIFHSTMLTSTLLGLFLFIPFILVPFIREDFSVYLNKKFLWLLSEGSRLRSLLTSTLVLFLVLTALFLMVMLAFGLSLFFPYHR